MFFYIIYVDYDDIWDFFWFFWLFVVDGGIYDIEIILIVV